ncbi:MAG: hypothetical protein BroJett011_20000 [Chloroflexota bacterium]|nr:MAG: hypothetical protein BroJett011_20000 [Chloroflexota bacterium]
MLKLTAHQWRYFLLAIIVVDMLIAGGVSYVITGADSLAATDALPTPPVVAVTVIVSPTPWPGPGPRPTPTATLPPTPLPTNALAVSGFPVGFTPTPRPTREPVYITLPQIFFGGSGSVDAPVINQIYYPEPFFPPGTNNACGPVALYAAFKGLGYDVDYGRLRDIAVSNGFDAEGISKWGLINTATTLNDELGHPLTIKQGDNYRTADLIRELRQKAVIVILVRVKKEAGQFWMTDDYASSFGHFLLVDRINTRTRTVQMAGSTLGMDKVPLADFVRAWSGQAEPAPIPGGWSAFLKNEPADNWALIIKRAR